MATPSPIDGIVCDAALEAGAAAVSRMISPIRSSFAVAKKSLVAGGDGDVNRDIGDHADQAST